MAPIHKSSNKDETVQVYLRLRPNTEIKPTLVPINAHQVRIATESDTQKVYNFTHVFDQASQAEIFDKVARPLVTNFISSGKDGLLFTYGITGSGKTYTMEGPSHDPGIIYRTIDFIFNSIPADQNTLGNKIDSDGENFYRIRLYPKFPRRPKKNPIENKKLRNRRREESSTSVNPEAEYCLYISLIELYNKKVIDLFDGFDGSIEKKKREIRADNRGRSYVANAVEIEVKSADEALELYQRGVMNRRTATTALNQASSRGHCVFNLKLVCHDKGYLKTSQLCLVDLAGSERVNRSEVTGEALHETANINNSLTALRKCFRELRDKKPPSSYRDCTLTRIFESYFKGYGTVCMVLCVNPTSSDFQENRMAMDFGLSTQDLPMDYASPPKKIRGTRQPLSDQEYFMVTIEKFESIRERSRKNIEVILAAQAEVRQTIVLIYEENRKQQAKETSRVKHLQELKSQVEQLTINNIRKQQQVNDYQKQFSKIAHLVESNEVSTKVMDILNNAPTAPLQSSSPIDTTHLSTSETTDPRTSPTNSTTDIPTRSTPVANLKYNRSLSCDRIKWIHHQPRRTIKTGTIFNPKVKNSKPVKDLTSSDILGKRAFGYSVVHQDADKNGDLETFIYKGPIIPTVSGGVQVILDDIETMRQESPKRKRAASYAA